MGIFVTKLAEQGSLMVLFLDRTFRIHEVWTFRSTKQVDHRHVTRGPIQLHKIVFVDPHRVWISLREIRTELIATGPLFRRVRQYDLLDGVLEGSQHCTEMQPPENHLDMMQGLVAYDLGSAKRGVELGGLLITLVHVRVEMIDQRLHSNKPCNSVRPGLSALVHVDVGDEEAGYSEPVLDGSEVLAKLRVQEFVLEILALANRKRHSAIEKTDPMPEKRKSLWREVEVAERGVVPHPGVLDRRRQG